MVLLDDQGGFKVGSGFPGIGLGGIAFPFDKVFAVTNGTSVFEDLLHFVGRRVRRGRERNDLEFVRGYVSRVESTSGVEEGIGTSLGTL